MVRLLHEGFRASVYMGSSQLLLIRSYDKAQTTFAHQFGDLAMNFMAMGSSSSNPASMAPRTPEGAQGPPPMPIGFPVALAPAIPLPDIFGRGKGEGKGPEGEGKGGGEGDGKGEDKGKGANDAKGKGKGKGKGKPDDDDDDDGALDRALAQAFCRGHAKGKKGGGMWIWIPLPQPDWPY